MLFGEKRLILKEFTSFAGVGVIGTLGHYIILITLVQFFTVSSVLASALGFTVGAVINYFLNYIYTFKSNKQHSEAIIKFFTVAILGLLLNTLIMFMAVESLAMHYLLGQVLATGMVLLWNFLGNKLWTFKEKARAVGE